MPPPPSLLLGLGVRELSMSAPAIGLVKQAVRSTDIARGRGPGREGAGLRVRGRGPRRCSLAG